VRCQNGAGLSTDLPAADVEVTDAVPQALTFARNAEYVSSLQVIANGTATIHHGMIVQAVCGVGFSPLLARVDAEHTARRANLSRTSNNYEFVCNFEGVNFVHGQLYYFAAKLSSCAGTHASILAIPALADLETPVLRNFAIYHSNDSLPSSPGYTSENETLHVSSASMVFVSSTFLDRDSGVASYEVSISSGAAGTQIIYLGEAKEFIRLDLSAYLLAHNSQHTISLRAADRAGHTASVHAFLSVDNSPPILGILLGGRSEIQVQCHGAKQVLYVHWTPSADEENRVVSYRVAAFMSPGSTQAVSTAVTGPRSLNAFLEIQDKFEHAVRQNSVLFLSLEAVNAAGLTASSTSGPLQVSCETADCKCNEDIVCMT